MKAIRVYEYGQPEVMRLEDVAETVPAGQEVLVKVYATGVNPVDTYIRSGAYAFKPGLPYTPGFDAAGVVEAVGQEVTGISVGHRVYTTGTITGAYAEKVLCKAEQIHALPEKVSFAQGAGLGIPYTTAFQGLFDRAKARPGETVLVHGASGAVGIAAVQLAKTWGMTVIGSAGTEKGKELVKQQGADFVVDHKTTEHWQEIMRITDGKGVDIVLEMLANVNLGTDLEILAKGGRVVVIGSRGKVEIDPRAAMMRDAGILGMVGVNMTRQEKTSAQAAIRAGLENGTLRPVVRVEMPLAQAPAAHRLVMEPGSYGKIILVP